MVCLKIFRCSQNEFKFLTFYRNLTTTMMCMYCQTVQPAGRTCINSSCKKDLAKYYCSDCKLWDDEQRKNIYHCHDCGICRIGKGLGQDYFHCKKCNVCMAISLQGKHKCIERNLESDCPICGEYMFTSTTTVIFMVRSPILIIAMRTLYSSQMSSRVYPNVVSMSYLFQEPGQYERLLSTNRCHVG
jgi:hypothetical protein